MTARDFRYWRDKALTAKRAAEYHARNGDKPRAAMAQEAYRIAAREAVRLGAACFAAADLI